MGLDFHPYPKPINPPSQVGYAAISLKVYGAAAIAGSGWTWALALLAARQHLTGDYCVLSAVPPLWGGDWAADNHAPSPSRRRFVRCRCCRPRGACRRSFLGGADRWWMCAWLIPALDLLRLGGVPVAMTFLEPLWLAAITGAAAGATVDVLRGSALRPLRPPVIPWRSVVWLLIVFCGGWWYYQGQQAYDNYLLGYNDFGHFGWRVANTWAGRGFLLETPSLPAFWDHFNPGLALLAPLWGLWPDPRLFLLIQAICLAVPAAVVFGIARRLGATSAAGAAWAAAYLAFPVVGQLNLNYGYGWHPVSLALPLVFLAIWALLQGRRTWAMIAAALACGFQEDVIVVLCCLALAFTVEAWLGRRRRLLPSEPAGSPRVPADALPTWGWGVVAAVLAATFVLSSISRHFRGTKRPAFPIWAIRPATSCSRRFYGRRRFGGALRPRCGYFLFCLGIPLGLRSLVRGWATLLAAAVPLAVLLVWSHPPATSIAFQYTTVLIPILFLAAMTGAARLNDAVPTRGGTAGGMSSSPLLRAGSRRAGRKPNGLRRFRVVSLEQPDADRHGHGDLRRTERRGRPRRRFSRHAILNQIVGCAGGKESAVLATGRVAAHLLAVRRLDTVGQACSRWKAFADEVGPGRSPIELFDWIVLDTKEHFYQSAKETHFVAAAAEAAHYRLVHSADGIVVYSRLSRRPSS